uniref:Reverse transcriptase domain-containing protein n=1 Tax=Cannabis sativa TaxID=3483 RepID=A0A803QGF5_CANSA
MTSSSHNPPNTLQLTHEENLIHDFDHVSLHSGDTNTSYCLVFKILTTKSPKSLWIEKAMREAWTLRFPVEITDYHSRLFLATFQCEGDRRRVLKDQPWHFDKCLMIFTNLEGLNTLSIDQLRYVPIWVQANNTPFSQKFLQLAQFIADELGDLIEIHPLSLLESFDPYLRLCVLLDVTKPLCRGPTTKASLSKSLPVPLLPPRRGSRGLSHANMLNRYNSDGLNAHFCQKNWDVMGKDLCSAILDVINNHSDLSPINETTLVLIPKKKNASTLCDFRPISLYSTLYKVISKVLANQLKPVLHSIISSNQSTFLSDRLIFDNIFIANELINAIHYRKNDKLGWAALKLDMEKAFDKSLSKIITPTRGIRQGDPLSPYIFFLMVAEGLSAAIQVKEQRNHFAGLRIYHNAPIISHLLFADDNILFSTVSKNSTATITDIFDLYKKATGPGKAFSRGVSSLSVVSFGSGNWHIPTLKQYLPFSQDYKQLVMDSWNRPIRSHGLKGVFYKTMRLKHKLKAFNKSSIGDIGSSYDKAKADYKDAQYDLQAAPLDSSKIEREKLAASQLQYQEKLYLSFLSQRSKIKWIQQGDSNTAYFHSMLKKRREDNRIVSFTTEQGSLNDHFPEVVQHFLNHFQNIMGKENPTTRPIQQDCIDMGSILTLDKQVHLLKPFSLKEVRSATLSIPSTKSPGPDGFGSGFFKSVWPEVGKEIHRAITHFFETNQFPADLHNTAFSLVPRVENPSRAVDYRPIACCTTLYKCISKLLCSRLAKVLPNLVTPNQGAFVKGRSISYNILILQDLLKNYKRKNCSPRFVWDLMNKEDLLWVKWVNAAGSCSSGHLVWVECSKTRDKLALFHITAADLLCAVCGSDIENHQHLFFTCRFSKMVLEAVFAWVGFSFWAADFGSWNNWLRLGHSSLIGRLLIVILAATIYHI